MINIDQNYFNNNAFIACKQLRDHYLNVSNDDQARALILACIDLAAMKECILDLEQKTAEDLRE